MTLISKNKASRNEADTRADLIDPQLVNDGWREVDKSFIRREVICHGRVLTGGNRRQPVSSEYVLVYKDRLPILYKTERNILANLALKAVVHYGVMARSVSDSYQ